MARATRACVPLHLVPTRKPFAKAAAALVALLSCASFHAFAQVPAVPGPQPAEPDSTAQSVPPAPPAPPARMFRWYNPLTWPFIPIPEIMTDPDGGTTVGVLPTWLLTNEQHQIDTIIAPDVQYNQYFGWGAHARILEFPSEDVQWSAVTGGNQRVQRKIDLEILKGRLRKHRWTYAASLIYHRDGTPRYYGLGNHSLTIAQTNYTSNQKLGQAQVGLNFTSRLQLLYTVQWQEVQILPGTLPRMRSIETLFGPDILGSNHALLHQLSVIYDSRDDVTIPTRGMRWIAYAGIATRSLSGTKLYSQAGLDGSGYKRLSASTVLAAHVALQYMPSDPHAAFWQLSSLGGGTSVPGGVQPLRGFGQGRFTDRNLFSATLEVRHRVANLPIFNTDIALEVTPFVDVGRVFHDLGASPIEQLHKVYGVGFRGVAAPFIVGFVDIGYGSEGAAVFTGVNYPF